MKILMTADTIGGVWTYALELTRALAAYDVTVTLATMGEPLTAQQWAEARSVANLEVCESNFKLEWMTDPWADIEQAGAWLMELERRVEPDLIHLNGYVHGALPWQSPVLMVGHSCVLSWWQAVKGETAPATWQRYQKEVGRGLRATDLVVAPTQAMLDELGRLYGPLPPSQVIANGCNPQRFVPGHKEPFVLCIGRLWDEAKNIAALERVAPRSEVPVYVAGATQHPEGGQAHCRNLHALGRLEMHELSNWLSRAAIYALPARYEPFGLSALEAALAGCALVLGDIPSLREVWGDAATFAPPDDEIALAAAINGLSRDVPSRMVLATKARARALEFSGQRMAQSYFGAYRDLINHHAAPGALLLQR